MPRKRKVPKAIRPYATVEETWKNLLHGYKNLRDYEGAENVARAKKLIKALNKDAELSLRAADWRDVGAVPREYILLRERLDGLRLKGDPLVEQTYAEIAEQVKAWISEGFTFESAAGL